MTTMRKVGEILWTMVQCSLYHRKNKTRMVCRLKVTWKMVTLIKDYAVKDQDTELGAAAMNKWIGTT